MNVDEMKSLAIAASKNAFAEFSKFRVGCAILTTDGDVITGCNVESPSLIFGICAERNAISTAITQAGKIEIEKVVIFTPTDKAVPPCGSCRQLIFEFGKNAEIISFCNTSERLDTHITKLLPEAFDFDNQ